MRGAREGGLTLIEVLVSLALLGVIGAAVLGLLPGITRVNTATRDEQRVVLVAKSFFERATAHYAVAANYDSPPPAVEGASDGLTCEPPSIQPVSPAGSSGSAVMLKRLTLKCAFRSRNYEFSRDYARAK